MFDFYTWSHHEGVAEAAPVPKQTTPQPEAVTNAEGILLLTHKDTDLLTFAAALDELPQDFPPVDAVNLMNVRNDAHMVDLLNEKGIDAR